jgi:hypothetical protein
MLINGNEVKPFGLDIKVFKVMIASQPDFSRSLIMSAAKQV